MGLLSSLLLNPPSPWPLRAAERLEVSIEGVVLPVEVQDLRAWVTREGAELVNSAPGCNCSIPRVGSLSEQLLQAPVLTRSSFGEQILRSWAAGPLLDAIADVVRLIDGDRISSEVVLTTLAQLLKSAPRSPRSICWRRFPVSSCGSTSMLWWWRPPAGGASCNGIRL